MIAALLSTTLPPPGRDDGNGFAGRPDGAEFTALPPEALSRLGPVRVNLLIAPTGTSELGVFAEMRPTGQTAIGTAAPHRQLLIGGLQAAQLAYAEDAAASMRDTWLDPGRVPALIRLRLHLVDEVAERQPVTVAVRRHVAGGCRFDPISLTCRVGDGH